MIDGSVGIQIFLMRSPKKTDLAENTVDPGHVNGEQVDSSQVSPSEQHQVYIAVVVAYPDSKPGGSTNVGNTIVFVDKVSPTSNLPGSTTLRTK